MAGSRFHALLTLGSSVIALATTPASAQSAGSAPQDAAAAEKPSGQDQATAVTSAVTSPSDDIIVTGTAQGRRRFDAAYAVSTVSEKQLQVYAPTSSADLIQKLPGFGSEPSGGEVGNNVNTRGLPASNFRFVALLDDGLPAFQEAQENFINADELTRLDLTVDRVEAVRGGPSSIYASNAPGGTINYVAKTGSQTAEGIARLTVGDYGLYRIDANTSGPLSPRLTYSAGGYYRISDGQRDPGFRADRGGQFRLSVTRDIGDGAITLYGKYLNDRNIFYLPVPLADPRNPSVSLSGLIDPNYGTLTSDDFRRVTLKTLVNGVGAAVDKDLADGVHSRMKQVGVNIDKDLGQGFSFSNKTRYMDSDVTFNALFSTSAPVGADTFAAGQLARARTGFGQQVTGLRYVLANRRNSDGSRITFDPATTGGLVIQSGWWNSETKLENFINDLRIAKDLPTGIGLHKLSGGIYFSAYDFHQTRLQNSILLNVKNNPDALDLVAVNAAGGIVGSVTDRGFVNYGNNADMGGRVEGSLVALYGADEWHIGDRLTIDAGFRKQWTDQSGYYLVRTTANLGDATTLADDTVGGPSGVRLYRAETFGAFAWTVGANYEFTSDFAVFGRYTKSFRTPAFGDIYTGTTQAAPIVTSIKMAEGGAKLRGDGYSLYATGFWNKFDPLTESISLPDANGGFVATNFIAQTETYGVELEGSVKPFPVFEVFGNLTLQNPQLKNLLNRNTGAAIPGVDGNQIRRFAKVLGTVTPTLHLKVADRPLDIYATVYHQGKRFVDSANATALPAFTTVDAGVILNVTSRLQLQAVGANLTNSTGLTEGNARVDQLSGQGTPVAIYARPVFGRNVRGMLTYRW